MKLPLFSVILSGFLLFETPISAQFQSLDVTREDAWASARSMESLRRVAVTRMDSTWMVFHARYVDPETGEPYTGWVKDEDSRYFSFTSDSVFVYYTSSSIERIIPEARSIRYVAELEDGYFRGRIIAEFQNGAPYVDAVIRCGKLSRPYRIWSFNGEVRREDPSVPILPERVDIPGRTWACSFVDPALRGRQELTQHDAAGSG